MLLVPRVLLCPEGVALYHTAVGHRAAKRNDFFADPTNPEFHTVRNARFADMPAATRKIAFLPAACGEKNVVTSSS